VQLGGHLVRAIAWMGGTLLSFTVMAISVRELSYDMHAFEMLFIRSAIGVAILTPIVWAAGWRTLRTKRLAGHLMRNAVHFTGQVLWIFGIALLPLATVSAIEFTTPVWGAILAVAPSPSWASA
jgi:drug/metabolite transporter (DMT)-like permease